MFENLFLVGDCRAEFRNGFNTFLLPSPRLLYRGLGLSFLYQAASCAQEPCPPSYLSIAAAGADFLVEEPLPEALTQQQTESEREVVALRETLMAIINDTEALKETMLTWQQRADTLEQQNAALQTRLHEEVQAREVLAQQVATQLTRKPTPRQRKQET